MAGFCPDGKTCKEGAHPKFPTDLKKPEVRVEKTKEEIEQERLERERQREREDEEEREREERNPHAAKFGRGNWHGGDRKKRGGRRHRRGGY
jgi:cleavage and polyadenylation specificity factor subunit 4